MAYGTWLKMPAGLDHLQRRLIQDWKPRALLHFRRIDLSCFVHCVFDNDSALVVVPKGYCGVLRLGISAPSPSSRIKLNGSRGRLTNWRWRRRKVRRGSDRYRPLDRHRKSHRSRIGRGHHGDNLRRFSRCVLRLFFLLFDLWFGFWRFLGLLKNHRDRFVDFAKRPLDHPRVFQPNKADHQKQSANRIDPGQRAVRVLPFLRQTQPR